jgi:signal transduction histidine kinase
LTEAERMNDDLTNMIVDDLKDALSGIAMMVQLALRTKGLGAPEMQRSHLLQIDRSRREMMRLLLDILDIRMMESGHMHVARAIPERGRHGSAARPRRPRS